MTNRVETLSQRIISRESLIGIIGLGYVGLPLANAFIEKGFRVLGFDVDPGKVATLNRGESYIKHISNDVISTWRESEVFTASSDSSRLGEADVLLICVPTPLGETREPDLSYVVATGETIAKSLRPGQLVVLESTTYPTTTNGVLKPVLDQAGLVCGEDYFLAYSPEREDPGNPNFTAKNIPKVVGGHDPNSLELATTFYRQAIVEVIPVTTAEIAEACKILENTYRAVNIALVNELKILFDRMGINVWEVIDAAKTKPFGFQAFYPGPGLGGHCIPIDPFYLTWLARRYGLSTRFIELAGEVNSTMPHYVITRLAEYLNDVGKPIRGSRILLLGMAYKSDVDDDRESPSYVLLEELLNRGAVVSYNDPYIPRLRKTRKYDMEGFVSRELTSEFLSSQDCVLIATNHSAYEYDFIVKYSQMVLDTRNATRDVVEGADKIRRA